MADSTEELKNPLDMTDEEILNLSFVDDDDDTEGADTGTDSDDEAGDDSDDEGQEQGSGSEESEEAGTSGEDEGGSEDASGTDESGETEGESDTEGSDEGLDVDKDADPDKSDTGDKDKKDDKSNGSDEGGEIDYKAFYEQMTASFRANGKDMQVTSAKDLIHLKEMGANYSQKMAGLKPALKAAQMLENNNLLDEKKLSFLIDLHNGDKTAIAKLIKDSGVDPLDIDVKQDSGYKQSDHSVTDGELDLRTTFKEIEGTKGYERTVDIVNNKWDAASQKVLLGNPLNITRINEQIGNGLFDKVMNVVAQERMLGRLTELSDLEAYETVGKQMQSSGQFATDPQASADESTKKVKPKSDPKLTQRRKAAGITKSTKTKSKAGAKAFNPLSLSDEDFDKYMAANPQ